jgi:hypothetical protein
MHHGKRETISVSSSPSGAVVSDGKQSWTTPALISLKRNEKICLTFSKEGYATQSVQLHRKLSWLVPGNIPAGFAAGAGIGLIAAPFCSGISVIVPLVYGPLIGLGAGIVGCVVDCTNGAQYTLTPQKVDVLLEPAIPVSSSMSST